MKLSDDELKKFIKGIPVNKELEDGDFYDELDKDDMLDRLQQNHEPASRMFWEKFVEIKRYFPQKDLLAIVLGADEPMDLESDEAIEFAAKIAKKNKYPKFHQAEDDVRLYGQNCLAERTFFFKKK
ncbi:hypothetical protein B0I26_10549 [Anoxybacillus vitaminiphilus]|uniref:Uncharacterized protein n=1 Tax=Paranoxybacillus vitaminiphilus TaxID=581036 RepID=A0A327YHP3_9BACL|nr:hypothetical protein [Anoxybacillus vitaminiphilus]RAK19867.1 hypothetical protein B0I26_10549 [Anoxybacillus vitaminiphilus]